MTAYADKLIKVAWMAAMTVIALGVGNSKILYCGHFNHGQLLHNVSIYYCRVLCEPRHNRRIFCDTGFVRLVESYSKR